MKIALYNENLRELEILLGQLDQCAREYLRFVEITPYVRQEDFCSLVRDGPEVDLFVVAQDGTFSLEIMELLWEKRPHAHIFGFRIWILPCVPIGTMRTGLGKSLWIFIACGKPLDRFCIGENVYDSVIEKMHRTGRRIKYRKKEEVLSRSDRK